MKVWLFKPFEKIAGWESLAAGLFVMLVTAIIAALSGQHTDGVLDLHLGPTAPVWVLVVQGLINWLSLSGCLLLSGLWLSHTRFRLIDLFGTQALARWPLIWSVLYLAVPPVGNALRHLTDKLLQAAAAQTSSEVIADPAYLLDALILTAISLPMLAFLAWMVWLMYHGYALVCNLSGMRAVFSFIGALVAAMIISKGLIWMLLHSTMN